MSLRLESRRDFVVLKEHDDWMVVGKPAPLLMHPTGKSDEVTLLSLLRESRPQEEVFFVNRLDRETSGCVLVAKSKSAARNLGKSISRGQIRKGYEAIVRGWPTWEEQRVEARLRRKGEFEESAIWVRQAVHDQGKESVTSFVVQRRLEKEGGKFSLIRCAPETGRTHQIRAHLELAGHGIVGDKIYGGDETAYLDFLSEGWTESLSRRLLLERQALHAATIEFVWEEQTVRVDCELPDELQAFCVA